MDFKSYLDSTAKNIDDELDDVLSQFLNDTKKTNIKLLPFALGLLNSTRGGKRIRAVLVQLGFEIVPQGYLPLRGGASPSLPRNDILKVSAAYEILHAGFLIHDDIMDESIERRGQPSLYQSLGGDHKGVSQAISVGDIALYLPIKLITETNFLGDYKLKAINCLSEIVMNTGWGQIMDIDGSDKEFIDLYKTAKYTIAGPLQLGAILAGADEQLLAKLGEFGESLGIAYQIKDDMLDQELENGEEKLLEYTAQAKKMIPEITSDAKMKVILEQMCKFLAERTV